jgi:hypothetical protein
MKPVEQADKNKNIKNKNKKKDYDNYAPQFRNIKPVLSNPDSGKLWFVQITLCYNAIVLLYPLFDYTLY